MIPNINFGLGVALAILSLLLINCIICQGLETVRGLRVKLYHRQLEGGFTMVNPVHIVAYISRDPQSYLQPQLSFF